MNETIEHIIMHPGQFAILLIAGAVVSAIFSGASRPTIHYWDDEYFSWPIFVMNELIFIVLLLWLYY